jgi:hypothetical protein
LIATLVGLAVTAAQLGVFRSPPPADWASYERANARLDGAAARDAAQAYLAATPTGPHALDASQAVTRLAGVGQRVGAPPVRWLIGRSPLPDRGPWVAILWEIWCHYCLPALKALRLADFPAEIPVVALTEATRGTPDETLRDALRDAQVAMPAGVLPSDGATPLHTGFWPGAVLVEDGRVAWVGHPENLTPEALRARLRDR